MFKIKIADTVFEIYNIHSFVMALCKDYIYNGEECDYKIVSTQELIDEEKLVMAEEHPKIDSYVENICVYRQIALKLLEKDAFVMHAATIGVDDKAYAFTAKSGTGKSTHIALWKRMLGDRVYAINGDKPIIKIVDGKAFVRESSCPDGVCISSGAISKTGETIICAPAGVSLTVKGGDGNVDFVAG